MSKIAKQGLFAVSLCALSVANALYATPNKPIQIDHEIPLSKKKQGLSLMFIAKPIKTATLSLKNSIANLKKSALLSN